MNKNFFLVDNTTLVAIWWSFWLMVTMFFELDRIIFINIEPAFHVFNFILFMYIAGQSFKFDRDKFYLNDVTHSFPFIFVFLALLVSIFFFSVNIYLAYKTYVLLSDGYSYPEVRGMFFAITPNGNAWFSSVLVSALYFIVSAIYSNLFMFIAIASKVFYKKNFLLLFLAGYLILDSFARGGGRGGVYSLILVYFLFFLAKLTFLHHEKKIFEWKAFFFIALLFGFIIWTTIARGGDFIYELIKYHTIGIHLFSILVENDTLVNVPLDYGRNFLGGIDYYLHYVIRLFFNEEYLSPFMSNSAIHDSYIVVSSHERTIDNDYSTYAFSWANDFFTMLSTAYSDFKGAGIVLMGIFVGISLKIVERKVYQHNSMIDITLYVYLTYSFLMGIFSTPFETPVFWVIIYIYFLIKRYSTSFFKKN